MADDTPTITVERAAELLHCGRTKVFELLAAGHLESAPRFGRKRTVITEGVRRLAISGLPRPGRKARRARPELPTDAGVDAALRRHTPCAG